MAEVHHHDPHPGPDHPGGGEHPEDNSEQLLHRGREVPGGGGQTGAEELLHRQVIIRDDMTI